jgi:hypothetical protein
MFQAFVIDTETHKVLAVFKPGGIEFNLDDCPETGISYRNHIVMKAKRLKAIH